MKIGRSSQALFCGFFLCTFAIDHAQATVRSWTNSIGGSWFDPSGWSPNGVPGSADTANINLTGIYTVAITNPVNVANMTLGNSTGAQTLTVDNGAILDVTSSGVVQPNGLLAVTNGGLQGQLSIQPGGQLLLTGPTASKVLYSLTLLNQGTVTWSGGGYLYSGGTPTTVISNGGLWQITSDSASLQGAGGPTPLWINSGILRKTAGAGTSQIGSFQFDNQPGGLVDVQSGTIVFNGATTNTLAGNFTTASGTTLNLAGGVYLDSGAVFSGAGVNEFTGTTLNLRTNILGGLLLAGGSVYVLPTFQQAGAITNLTLDGSTLHGTNQVTFGTLTINSGGADGQLTVQPTGQLLLGTGANKVLYSLTLLNQGTVTWSGSGYIYSGGNPTTVISNGGLWQMTSDTAFIQGAGGPTPLWTNPGILRKTPGTGTSQINNFQFDNQPGGLVDVQSGTIAFNGSTTNTLAGNFTTAAGTTLNLGSGIYLDAAAVFSGAGVNEFTGTTLDLRTNILSGLLLAGGGVYVLPTFQQAGTITNLTLDGATLHGNNQVNNGALTMNSGGLDGQLTIQPAGQLLLGTAASKVLYSLTLLNQGTVTWSGSGYLYSGGNPTTVISNGGLWQMTSDTAFIQGAGGPNPLWTNPGILRKTAGAGTSQINNFQFDNQPGGLVDVQSGTIVFSANTTNTLAGNFTTAPGTTLNLAGGLYLDSAGVFSGAGISEFTGTTLNLRTNILSGLLLAGGSVYVLPTFQQAGAITNLTLDGSTLHGTNQVGFGKLTVDSGGVDGQLTVQPAGQLLLSGTGSKVLYSLSLFNQGTVTWSGGGYLYSGGTPTTVVSNGGLWQMTSDSSFFQGAGGPIPLWTNRGTVHKTAGAATSQILNFQFDNSSNGMVEVDTGTLLLPSGFTNTAGMLRLNGGTLGASGTLTMTGGTLDGSGTLGANALNGGIISPGFSPGSITFPSGLNLDSNATLVIEGTGTIPGSQYDQLSVTGPVVLGNATLQVTSMPSVSAGTTFVIITNITGSAISGTFSGLPENSVITASGQPFRIHYGGTGNNVKLVRDIGPAAPNLSAARYTNGAFGLLGAGSSSLVYTIQATTNFLQWTTIGSATGDVSGNFNFTDTNALNFQYRFYRTTN